MSLPIRVVPAARAELRSAAEYYRDKAPDLAQRFLEDFRRATELLANQPGAGSLRFAHLLEGRELRTWSFQKFPFRLFYFEEAGELVIVAVQHERQHQASLVSRLKR